LAERQNESSCSKYVSLYANNRLFVVDLKHKMPLFSHAHQPPGMEMEENCFSIIPMKTPTSASGGRSKGDLSIFCAPVYTPGKTELNFPDFHSLAQKNSRHPMILTNSLPFIPATFSCRRDD
jgi:hypothetical protein